MTDKSNLMELASRQSGVDKVYYNNSPIKIGGKDYYEPVFDGTDVADDFVMLLRGLPEIVHDHLALSEAVNKLAAIIIQQQMQINELTYQLEEVVRANITLKAQENVHGIIERLTAQGSDVSKPEIVIKMSAKMSGKMEDRSEELTRDTVDKSRAVSGNIQALSQLLSGLKLGASAENSDFQERAKELKRQTSSLSDASYQGDVIIRFESITGNPMVKAQAEAVMKGISSPKKE
jgi:hypothetical protein